MRNIVLLSDIEENVCLSICY